MIIEDIPDNNFSSTSRKNKKNQIDYDDILRNMGMREVKGKLFWEKNQAYSNENFIPCEPGQSIKNSNTQQPKSSINKSLNKTYHSQQADPNSYIYNKYFKNEFKQSEEKQKPRNLIEYRNMLIRRIIERKRVEEIKSRQMIFK